MREKISKARMRTPIAAVLAASLTAIAAARAARGDVKDLKEPTKEVARQDGKPALNVAALLFSAPRLEEK